VLALVVAAVALHASQNASTTAIVHPPTATSVTTSIDLTDTPEPPPLGWSRVLPEGTMVLALSQGRRYACGNADGRHIFFARSFDNGVHWSALQIIADGLHCTIATDPQDASLVAISLNSITNAPAPSQCLRSFDGGVTFGTVSLPDQTPCDGTLQWVGDTLFA